MPKPTLVPPVGTSFLPNPVVADAGHAYFDMTPAVVASRIASINVAASLVATGTELADRRLAESIVADLNETAAWFARQLTQFFDDKGA